MKAKKAPISKRTATRPRGKILRPAATAAILGLAPAPKPGKQLRDIPSKWRRDHQRLLELRARLEAQRSGQAQTASQPLETYSMDMADAATDEFEHNLALCELSAGQDALYEIDEALKRIANGTYGICQLSGKPISRARLDALPWTRFTSEAERQLELEGVVGRARLGELRSIGGAETAALGETEPGEEEPAQPPSDETLARVPPAPAPVSSAPAQPIRTRRSPVIKQRRNRRGKR